MKKRTLIILLCIAAMAEVVYFAKKALPKYRYTVERHYLDGGCDTIVEEGVIQPRPHYSRWRGYKDAVCRIRILKKEREL